MAPLDSQNHWLFYQCLVCGPITMPPSGLVRRTHDSDYAAAAIGHGTSTLARQLSGNANQVDLPKGTSEAEAPWPDYHRVALVLPRRVLHAAYSRRVTSME